MKEEEEELKTLFFREQRVKWRERKKKSYKKLIQNQRGEGKAVKRKKYLSSRHIFFKKSCILRGKQVSTLLLWLTKCE